MNTVLMLVVVNAVQAQLSAVMHVNNVYTACHNTGTTCSPTWIHTTHMLPRLVYIYTAMVYGAMTWHHSDQNLQCVFPIAMLQSICSAAGSSKP